MASRKPKPRKTKKEKTEEEKAAERFVEDLLIRGEAAHPGPQGELPPGATHEIVEEPGRSPIPPKVRRRRFSTS
jgi:hypothetical protein